MLQSWRWYGPNDLVSLDHIKQTGANAIVTALHEIYDGRVWPLEDILARKTLIENSGLTWSVVESIPVHASIKLDNDEAPAAIDRFIVTMKNLAKAGIKAICYNFMPVVDWTRTDLCYKTENGGLALRFDPIDFAAYDIFVLRRKNAEADYNVLQVAAAKARFKTFDKAEINVLESNIISGLPGSELNHSRTGIAAKIAEYDDIDSAKLQKNLIKFLKAIIPVAEEYGLRMCLHPDDPPFSLFGLPRVLSTADDYRTIFDAVPAENNGITFCIGSLGARADNDIPAMIKEFSPRIHFAHLRNVKREESGAFFEDDHLAGSTDMVEVVKLLLAEENRRESEGRADWQIPMRPDHGHLLLDDINKKTNPGYSAIGRLKGLAELRGIMMALKSEANKV